MFRLKIYWSVSDFEHKNLRNNDRSLCKKIEVNEDITEPKEQ